MNRRRSQSSSLESESNWNCGHDLPMEDGDVSIFLGGLCSANGKPPMTARLCNARWETV